MGKYIHGVTNNMYTIETRRPGHLAIAYNFTLNAPNFGSC